MFGKRLSAVSTRLKHSLVALLFVGTQVVFPLSFSGVAHAATNYITASTHQGQMSDGSWSSGDIKTYRAGQSINFRFTLDSSQAASGDMLVNFSDDGGSCTFFTNSFTLGTPTPVSGATPTVSTVGSATAITTGSLKGDWGQTLNVSFAGAGKAVINYTLTLSTDAGNCSGSSQHSQLNNATNSGDFANIGALNVPVPAKDILPYPTITTQTSATSVYTGSNVSDTATLTGDSKFTPLSGSVAFYVCFDASSTPNCSTDGTGTLVSTETISPGTGYSGSATSENYQPAAVGNYCFRAEYTPDSNAQYSPTSETNTSFTSPNNECFTATAAPNGSITISKDAIPDSSTSFPYTTTGTGVSNFSLTNDGTNSNSRTFSSLTAGTYTFTEGSVSGWDFDNISCTNASGNSTITKSGTEVSITLASDDSVSCTYTNRQRGHIVVHKVTNPANDSTNFTVTASGTPTISGATAINGSATRTDLSTSNDVTYDVAQGTYSVTETAASGWSEDDSACANLTVDGNTPLVSGVPTVECTITNTKLAKLNIVKSTDPSSSSQTFSFTATGPSGSLTPFTLDTNSSDATYASNNQYSDLALGDYTVTEASTSGWQLTDLACVDNSNNSAFPFTQSGTGNRTLNLTLAAGDDVTCTFTNTQLMTISGYKYNVDATATSGDGTGTAIPNWNIYLLVNGTVKSHTPTDGSGYYEFTGLLPGTYSLAECLYASDNCSTWTNIYAPSDVTLANGNNSSNNNFGNFQNASISGYKFEDLNGNGQWDAATEKGLSGWTIYLYDSSHTKLVDTTTTQNDGSYEFTNVTYNTDGYLVCEKTDSKPGYSQTYPDPTVNDGCHTVTVILSGNPYTTDDSGQAINFGNYPDPSMTISKSNNQTTPGHVGDTVTYTIVVTVPTTSGDINNATVTDLPPANFTVDPSSETATLNGNAISVNPNYGSPGLWSVGTLHPGDILTLIYKAKIGSVANGHYPDLAFVKGQNAFTSSTVLGSSQLNAVAPAFVGTTVAVISTVSPTTFTAGQVLGAEILVNTGTNLLSAQYILPIILVIGIYITRRMTEEKGGK